MSDKRIVVHTYRFKARGVAFQTGKGEVFLQISCVFFISPKPKGIFDAAFASLSSQMPD